MSIIRHYNVALVSESASLPFSALAPVAAALSTQMIRDVAPQWNVAATVTAFPTTSAIPVGYYPIIVMDNINQPGAAGYHTDANNQPYSLIEYDSSWSVTASHENVEMCLDPWGNRLYPGVIGGKAVQVLEELCDPVEDFTYTISGVSVSDFVLADYYSGVHGSKYSFLGKVSAPWQVANNGYISYILNNNWYQITNFGSLVTTNLGPAAELTKGFKTLKEAIDNYGQKNHPKIGKTKLTVESMFGPF